MMSTKPSATTNAKSVKDKKAKDIPAVAPTVTVVTNDDESEVEDEKEKCQWKDGDNLIRILRDKSREIEKLKVLLETLEPIPGMDPEKYNQFVFNGIDDAFDFRDTKIVSLAKKVRSLSMKVNKVNAINEMSKKDLQVLHTKYNELRSDHEELQRRDKAAQFTSKPENERKLQTELASATKIIDDLRRRQQQLLDEVRNLQRALRSELGDGTTLEQAMEPTWRGRADQLAMVKIRLRKYETGMIGTSTLDNNRGSRGSGNSQSYVFDRSHVDTGTKVLEDLAGISAEKRQINESLVSKCTSLQDENSVLESKLKGLKARSQTTERELVKFKQQIQLLLNKANTDDELIEALRAEIHTLRSTTVTMTNDRAKQASHDASVNDKAEVLRLQRLCKQQVEQLTTQDELIRELRASIKP